MRFLADENVASSVVFALRQARHDVFDVKEAGWQGKTDVALASFARAHRRIILSHDKDFLFTGNVSVFLLRFYNQKPVNVAKRLINALLSSSLKNLKSGTQVIITEEQVEIHHP